MPADLLRRAAARLREVASAAKPGPWESHYSRQYGTLRLRSMAEVEFRSDAEILVAHTLGAPETVVEGTRVNFDYFATLHPPVALALADWLDEVAAWPGLPHMRTRSATAVAREILREPEENRDA